MFFVKCVPTAVWQQQVCMFALVWLYIHALFRSGAQHTHANMKTQWGIFYVSITVSSVA